MKKIPRRLAKKGLSLMLAMCIVCAAAITTTFPAFTQEATIPIYTVKSTSPAIPMDVKTVVKTQHFEVETTAGTVLGNTLDYTLTEATEDVVIDNDADTITAYKKGVYEVTATNGSDINETLYIVVKNTDETEWVLYDHTFTENVIPSDWVAQYRQENRWQSNATFNWSTISKVTAYASGLSGTSEFSAPGVVPFGYSTYNNVGYFMLKNKAVNSFSDYTVNAQMVGFSHKAGTDATYGIIGRSQLTDGKLTNNTTMVGAVVCTYPNSSGDNVARTFSSPINPTWHNDTNPLEFGTATAYTFGNANSLTTSRDMTVKFSGSQISFKDSTNDTTLTFDSPQTAQKGAVGVRAGVLQDTANGVFTNVNIRSFTVKLNNENTDKPYAEKLTEIEIYTVNQSSPAIPMNAMTVINTKYIEIETANGTVAGNTLDFELVKTSAGVVIDNNADTIKAYLPGVYEITATNGSDINETLYIVVKNKEDSEWVLYDRTFTENVIPSDWVAQYRQENRWQTTPTYEWADISAASDYSGVTNSVNMTAPGVVPFAYTHTMWNGVGYFMLNDKTVNSFSDYTVNAKMVGYSHKYGSDATYGVIGRAKLTEGKLTNNTTMEGAVLCTYDNDAGKSTVRTFSSPVTPTKENGVSITNTTDYEVANKNNLSISRDMTVKFSGNQISFKDSTNDNTLTFATTQATQKGSIGIRAGVLHDEATYSPFTRVNIRNVTVKLNNAADNLPHNEEIADIEPIEQTVYVSRNSFVKLADVTFTSSEITTTGEDLSWTKQREVGYELDSVNKVFAAYQNGSYTLNPTFANTTHNITFVVTDDENVTKLPSTPIADITGGEATISPIQDKANLYSVTLSAASNKVLKALSLKQNGTPIIASTDTTGLCYEFTASTPADINITAEFIEDNGQFNSSMLGASINSSKSGIRFGVRTDYVRLEETGNFGYLRDTILVTGEEITPTDIGMLLIPTALIPAGQELTMETPDIVYKSTKKCTAITEQYSDLVLTLVGIPDTMLDTPISSRMYVAYEENGETKYIYSNQIERSYNGVNESALNGIKIVSDFEGANIKVKSREGNTVNVDVDLRDTTEDWFYWCFKVENAAGMTLTFSFPNTTRVGYYGAAISYDYETWHWQYENMGHEGASFTYTFGIDENAVYFAHDMLYRPERFMEFAAEKNLEVKTLCQSEHGTNVPYVEFGNGEELIVLTARHHACESTGSYFLEGVLEEMLADEFFSTNYKVICVPMVDIDGVIKGDQGKLRAPHDHNRDYGSSETAIYPSVAELCKIAETQNVKYAFDFHSPWHLGGANDTVFFPIRTESIVENMTTFSTYFENRISDDAANTLPYNKKNNTLPTAEDAESITSFAKYFAYHGAELTTAPETPFFNAEGVKYTPEKAINTGKAFAKAIKDYAQQK